MRIHGTIGGWPVDLTLELDEHEWAALAPGLSGPPTAVEAPVRHEPAATPQEGLWQGAQDLLREAGSMEGPQLLADLEALAGGAAAGKRLLVRLRHSPQVRLEAGVDAPVYHWIG
ncbi:hypothetical protein [Pseudomonas sp. RIT-PI-AD]|uniref:hypothetical protein n=1 Tax=Pseudomonas sp. RIT-PI-AD TaxID=3035294 RepID=UPI0021D8584A|nr:hypothetical protein [Pseudomonas sp. RIT-PI-AD]